MFDDKKKQPKPEQLRQELGRSSNLWRALIEWLAKQYNPLHEEWVFYAQNWGWSLKLKHKKRTVLYLTPCKKYFLVGFVLGERAVSAALDMDLPKSVKDSIRAARKYVEGRAVRLEVRNKQDLLTVKCIAEAKMAN